MSRGFGRWQNALVRELYRHRLAVVSHVVMEETEYEPTRAAMVAAHRAARSLVAEGIAERQDYLVCRACDKIRPAQGPHDDLLRMLTRSPRTYRRITSCCDHPQREHWVALVPVSVAAAPDDAVATLTRAVR